MLSFEAHDSQLIFRGLFHKNACRTFSLFTWNVNSPSQIRKKKKPENNHLETFFFSPPLDQHITAEFKTNAVLVLLGY